MNTVEYNELLVRVSRLEPEDQVRFSEDVSVLVERLTAPSTRSERGILELEGLGREVWHNRDAQECVHQERDAWNG